MVFTDGYSFVMYAVSTAVMLVAWAWNRWRNEEVWLAMATYIMGIMLAYFLYKMNAPIADSWASSITLYRSSGIDLITLISPTGGLWWTQLLGIEGGVKGLWGDGANSAYNYIGVSIIVLASVGIYLVRKKLSRIGIALLVIACASFVLSLGPSLKINSQHITDPSAPGFVTRSPYRMPESDAVMPLPTAYAYKLPGIKSMRATYRWHVLTKLVLIVFACMAIQYLIKHKKSGLAYVILLIMLVELLPNPVGRFHYENAMWKRIDGFQTGVVGSLKNNLKLGDRVVYFPNARGDNDFLVNYLTPETKTWTYNVGGDKAVVIARRGYPPTIKNLISSDKDNEIIGQDSGGYMATALNDGLIDKVVIPKFGLKWNATRWPPTNDNAIARAEIAAKAASDNGLYVVERKYFYIVSLQ